MKLRSLVLAVALFVMAPSMSQAQADVHVNNAVSDWGDKPHYCLFWPSEPTCSQ